MSESELIALLPSLTPVTPESADVILDLRETLLAKGHPGTCVQCFFSLLQNSNSPGSLTPLRNWLESNLEVTVAIENNVRETLPVALETSETLSDYCHRVIETIRTDRIYTNDSIRLGFRYRKGALTV